MAYKRIPWVKQKLNLMIDDHPGLLLSSLVLLFITSGIAFYIYFWPIISNQPEYVDAIVLNHSDNQYSVIAIIPQRLAPDDQKYEFSFLIRQQEVITQTQQLTLTLRSLSPFLAFKSGNVDVQEVKQSFTMHPLTPSYQEARADFLVSVTRPVNRPASLPIQLILSDGNAHFAQKTFIQIDYWSHLIVYLVTGGILLGLIIAGYKTFKSIVPTFRT